MQEKGERHLFDQLIKALDSLQWFAISFAKIKGLTKNNSEDVLSIIKEQFVHYYNGSRLKLVGDDNCSKIAILVYICKSGRRTYVPKQGICAWLKKIIKNEILTLKKKEGRQQNVNFEDHVYHLSDDSYRKRNGMELRELSDKINQLGDAESVRILQLILQGYKYGDMISILVEEDFEEAGQDYKKLEEKLRQKKCRAIKQLRTIYGLKNSNFY